MKTPQIKMYARTIQNTEVRATAIAILEKIALYFAKDFRFNFDSTGAEIGGLIIKRHNYEASHINTLKYKLNKGLISKSDYKNEINAFDKRCVESALYIPKSRIVRKYMEIKKASKCEIESGCFDFYLFNDFGTSLINDLKWIINSEVERTRANK